MIALSLLVACQTRNQAKLVTAGAGTVALVGGYFERDQGNPPITLMGGGAIALISILSMAFLDGQPRTLLGTPLAWRPEDHHGDSELLAGIRRTGHSVAIYRDGDVEYTNGARAHLDPDRIRDLERRLANVPALDDDYDTPITDTPTIYIWYRPPTGPTKTITHHGPAPDELFAIEQALDRAVEPWIGEDERW